MEARIAKNNEFKTIGLNVIDEQTGRVEYTWGITPDTRFNYVKRVDLSLENLIRLISLRQEIVDLENFMSRFFDIALESKALKKEKDGNYVGVKFDKIDTQIENLKHIQESIIEKLA